LFSFSQRWIMSPQQRLSGVCHRLCFRQGSMSLRAITPPSLRRAAVTAGTTRHPYRLSVWTGVWYWYLRTNPEGVLPRTWYFCYGLMASGVVLLVIGLAVGQIGRQARHAELPPPEIKNQEAKIDPNAAARPVVVAMPGAVQPGAQPAAVPAPTAVPASPPVAPLPRT
jgi:hypothetical protein